MQSRVGCATICALHSRSVPALPLCWLSLVLTEPEDACSSRIVSPVFSVLPPCKGGVRYAVAMLHRLLVDVLLDLQMDAHHD